MKSAGHIFKSARERLGLTQVQVAQKSGIHINTYTRIERGEQNPTFATIKKIAKALNISTDDIPA